MRFTQAVLCGRVASAANAVCSCGSTGGAATAHSKAVLVVSLLGCFPLEVLLFDCAAPGCGLKCHVLATSVNCLPATPTAWDLSRVRGEGQVFWIDLQLLALCDSLVSAGTATPSGAGAGRRVPDDRGQPDPFWGRVQEDSDGWPAGEVIGIKLR